MPKFSVQITAAPGAILPTRQTPDSAGMDLHAFLTVPLTLSPGQRSLVPTGIKVALPTGYQMEIRGRSGLALKYGIGLANGVGTIDADYRGEIGVILINHGEEDYTIQPGDRIAQAVITAYKTIDWQIVDELDETMRGEGGFGSTNK